MSSDDYFQVPILPEPIATECIAFAAPPCEVCGKPATCGVRDIREKPSLNYYREYEPYGLAHFYCDDHDREPVFYPAGTPDDAPI